jgi:ERCC4-related helicase
LSQHEVKNDIENLISIIENCSVDSKAESIVKLCKKLVDEAGSGRVVVYSRYRSTVSYLFDYLSEALENVIRINNVTGVSSFDWGETLSSNYQIVVVSDDRVQGLEFPHVHSVVNVDPSINSSMYVSRLLRVANGESFRKIGVHYVEDETNYYPYEKKMMRRRMSDLIQALHGFSEP